MTHPPNPSRTPNSDRWLRPPAAGFLLGLLIALCLMGGAPQGFALSPDDARSMALGELQDSAEALGLSASDLEQASLSSHIPNSTVGVSHIYLQQRFQGYEVHNAIATVSFDRHGQLISLESRFVADLEALASVPGQVLTATQAAALVAFDLELQPTEPLSVVNQAEGPDQATELSTGGLAREPIQAKLMWYPSPTSVRLAWKVELEPLDGFEWWHLFVDAETGETLGRFDMVSRATSQDIADASVRDVETAAQGSSFPAIDGAAYNVFPQARGESQPR